MTPAPLRVVVADDHRLFRDGVRALLAVTGGIEVVGEAADTDAAVALAGELQPDVVLMDLQMPGHGGLTATAEITARHPGVAVLVLSMLDQEESVLAAIRAGARGYILKDTDAEDLVRAIAAAARGEAIFGASVAPGLLAFVGGRTTPPPQAFPDLSPSERSVLSLLAQGHDNRRISQQLSLSEKTVRNYVSSVFRKLGVTDRARAVVVAREAGLHHPAEVSRSVPGDRR